MRSRLNLNDILAYIVASSIFFELLLIVGSWAISSSFPDINIHSLLDSEGIRWFFGHFTSNLQSPLLVWLILFGVGRKLFLSSTLPFVLRNFFQGHKTNFRERIGLSIVAAEVLFASIVIAFLSFIPQAILLSVSGDLFPSSFSESIVATLSFVLLVTGSTFALVTGKIRSISSWFLAMTSGIVSVAPLIVAYIFVVQLISSVCFVFSFMI